MVSFRGINVCVISQAGIERLPEYSSAEGFNHTGCPTVACYIPIYSGAQIWFEYSIDGPHPPKVLYLFKLFINGQHITNWDCAPEPFRKPAIPLERLSYSGKAVFSLYSAKATNFTGQQVGRSAFIYSTRDATASPGNNDDCIEIRVHRIGQRRRIRSPGDIPVPESLSQNKAVIRLADMGLLEAYQPARRYQYLLIDPQDQPYATFCFYCRSPDYLERHSIIQIRSVSPTSIATSTSQCFDDFPFPLQINPVNSVDFQSAREIPGRYVTSGGSPMRKFRLEDQNPWSSETNELTSNAYIPQIETCTDVFKDSSEGIPSVMTYSSSMSSFYSPQPRKLSEHGDQLPNHSLDFLPTKASPTINSSPLLPALDNLCISKGSERLSSPVSIAASEIEYPTIEDDQRSGSKSFDLHQFQYEDIQPEIDTKSCSFTASSQTVGKTRSASATTVAGSPSPFDHTAFLGRFLYHGVAPLGSSEDLKQEESTSALELQATQVKQRSTGFRSNAGLGFLIRKSSA